MELRSEPPGIGILHLPDVSPFRAILRRTLLALALLAIVTVLLWFDRDGLRDNAHPNEPVEFLDVFYFTVVSLATVGYGDVAPVSDQARLINSLLLTPVRIFVWFLFLGTAYEVTLLRLQLRESYRMRQLRERLDDHIIICGYGVKGRAIVDELLAHRHEQQDVVIIDPSERAVSQATEDGFVALCGDASSESMLRAAAIEKASYVLAAPDRDDACVLICLTVRSMAPDVQLIAAARESENVKLLYGAGADLVVSPSVSGGRLMAAAVDQRAVAAFLQDLLSIQHGSGVAERITEPHEVGILASELPDLDDCLILSVMRGRSRYSHSQVATLRLEAGDAIVYLVDKETVTDATPDP